ncbi:kilA protein, putative phage-related DNA binding protein [Streptococcus sp. DD10]|nr:kilA protein, putative phage-related DNA binding protein [Streptococcus sp. DD10]
MTTQSQQPTFFHAFEKWKNENSQQRKSEVLKVVTTQKFGTKHFDVYGDIQNPLFVAVEVAEMIEIQNTTDLLKRVDDDEKLTYVISRAGQKREMNMLTEFGVYEVLSQSRKPLAKEFKKVVKHILKEIRLKGYYMAGELVEEPQTTIKAPDTLAEAERYYIDTLAKAIAEAKNMDEKGRLTSKLTRFMQEVEPQWN